LAPQHSRIHVRLLAFASVPVLLIAGATIGYHVIERWPWFDALYVAVITLTSIGYTDKHSLSPSGRVFTMALALIGIFSVAIAATEILSMIFSGELRELRRSRRMRKHIEQLKGHVIVCGYGSVGQHVCADLLGDGVPFVVIDRREGALAACREAGAHPVLGDATADEILRRAGVERARAVVAVAGTDADNVLITMTARLLCPALPIVARADDEATVPKLLRAGATRTISPHAIVGRRLAQAVLRPALLDFIEVATRLEYPDLQMEAQLVAPGSPLDGKSVAASGIRSQLRLILVAIKHRDGRLAFNPADDVAVVAGDTLITLGRRDELARIDALALCD
jgi:voltage-gated potassium channel